MDVVDESLISTYCVVAYDDVPYPGIILDVDGDELEVKVMHKVGNNRYFWLQADDILWYTKDIIVALLEGPPQPVTSAQSSRHKQIADNVWQKIQQMFD